MALAKKLAVILGTSAMTLAGAASAQQPAPKFSSDDAAYCTATFGWILQVLGPSGLPEATKQEANFAYQMWSYELQVANPTADQATMDQIANNAIQKLGDNMPQVAQDQAGAQKIVEFVMSEAGVCGEKMFTAYPEGDHPVLAALREQQGPQNGGQSRQAQQPPKEPERPPLMPLESLPLGDG